MASLRAELERAMAVGAGLQQTHQITLDDVRATTEALVFKPVSLLIPFERSSQRLKELGYNFTAKQIEWATKFFLEHNYKNRDAGKMMIGLSVGAAFTNQPSQINAYAESAQNLTSDQPTAHSVA